MVRLCLAAVMMLATAVANAQQLDPRLAEQTVQALQAVVTLRDAQIKVLIADHEKQIAELQQKCGEPCKKDEK